MAKLKSLNRFQKVILLFMLVMAVVFLVLYCVAASRVGFEFRDTILAPSQENGSTVYSGKIKGQEARFTLSADKTAVFQYGGKTYGPYTVKEDPSAIPCEGLYESMIGVELCQGEAVLFRGGILKSGMGYWLYTEDGNMYDFQFSPAADGVVVRDESGNGIDTIAPSASDIIDLMYGARLTHKGNWLAWFGAMLICVINAALIFFADELFRLNMSLHIRNSGDVEPTNFELAGRETTWVILALLALAAFILGLK